MRIILAVFFSLPACVSGSKRLDQIDQALKNPKQLEELCKQTVTGACALTGQEVVHSHQLPVLQSVTTDVSARIVVVAPKKARLIYYVRSNNGQKIFKVEASRTTRDFSDEAVDQLEVFDLSLQDSYELFILDEWANLWDRRKFSSLDLKKKNPRIALMSCMDDKLVEVQSGMWKQLLEQSPDAMLMIGDNVYADRLPEGWQAANEEQLWTRYVQTRLALEVFKASKLVPVFATWDDHDYGRNDSDRTNPFKEEALKVFLTFFAQSEPAAGFERGPGVASRLDAFGMRFILTDDRYFRSPNKSESEEQTHFGLGQENWIDGSIKESKVPVFLISGDQFFGGYQKFESYEGSHPKSFARELGKWKKSKVPLVFLSGDRHLTEIIQVPSKVLGFPTYELTSSPLHAKVFAEAFIKDPSPNQLRGAGVSGEYNYMVLQPVAVRKNSVEIFAQSFGPKSKMLFERKLKVKR